MLINKLNKLLLVEWVNYIYKFIQKELKDNLVYKLKQDILVSIIDKLLLKNLTLIIYIKNKLEVLVNMLELLVISNLSNLMKLSQNVNLLVKLLVLRFHHNMLLLSKKHFTNWWIKVHKQVTLSLVWDMFLKMVPLT
jgi:hypothetical protein